MRGTLFKKLDRKDGKDTRAAVVLAVLSCRHVTGQRGPGVYRSPFVVYSYDQRISVFSITEFTAGNFLTDETKRPKTDV